MRGFEILEHTADVGVRAAGGSLAECFEQASLGLADIMGIWRPGGGEEVEISLEADDLGALLVDWLSEILWLHDSRDADLAGLEVTRAERTSVQGTLKLAPRAADPAEGTQVKAITYHQLNVEQTDEGWVAEVYVDV